MNEESESGRQPAHRFVVSRGSGVLPEASVCLAAIAADLAICPSPVTVGARATGASARADHIVTCRLPSNSRLVVGFVTWSRQNLADETLDLIDHVHRQRKQWIRIVLARCGMTFYLSQRRQIEIESHGQW